MCMYILNTFASVCVCLCVCSQKKSFEGNWMIAKDKLLSLKILIFEVILDVYILDFSADMCVCVCKCIVCVCVCVCL